MDLFLVVLLGLIAGWIASIVMHVDSGVGILMDTLLGMSGAIIGGVVMNLVGLPTVSGFDVYSVFIATTGAIILIVVGKKIQWL